MTVKNYIIGEKGQGIMKILYLASNPLYTLEANSGYGAHMRGIINSFRKKGHIVKTIIGRDEEERENIGVIDVGTTSRIKKLKRFILNFLWQDIRQISLIQYNKRRFRKLIEIVQDFKPDVIYERAEYLSTAGVKIGEKFDIPVFIEANAILEWEWKIMNGKSLLNFWGKKYERFVYQNCNAIFAISEPVKERIVKKYWINESRITVVSNGVDPEKFILEKSKREMRRMLGISDDEVVVGYVGSIFPWHGLENLIESANVCLKEMPNLRFLIVGDGETRKGLEEKSREYKICDKVIFTGRVPREKVPDYLQIMDICVYPGSKEFSDIYHSPIKNFEYGIMAKPIISCNSRVVRETMKNGIDGILITPGSVSELSEAILKLAKNPALRKELGENFKRKVIAHYTWDKIGEKKLEVMKNAIGE